MAVVEQADVGIDAPQPPGSPGNPLPPPAGADTLGHGLFAACDPDHDAVLARAMRVLDPEVARSFTPEQRRAVRTMLDLRFATEHLVDVRRGFNLGGRRYFLALLLGRERRRLSHGRPKGLAGWLESHALLLIAAAGLLVAVFTIAALLRG